MTTSSVVGIWRPVLAAVAAIWLCTPTATNRTPPRGIYCSCPPTSPRSHSVMPAVATRPFVSGILVRVAWSDLERVEGQPDWALLDAELALAEASGKQVALAVLNGPAAPDWLADRGAQVFGYSFRGAPSTMPVPWDPVHLDAWTGFIDRLGERYRDHPAISLVHMTHATANGFEMQLPFAPEDRQAWQRIGYDVDRHAASWRTVIDAFDAAFPYTPLDVDVHPVLGSDRVAEEVVAHGQRTLGRRFGVFAGWWSRHNATAAYPGMYRLIQDAAARSFATTQMVASFTRGHQEGFRQPSPAAALTDTVTRLGFEETGVGYFEIWNEDILNEDLAPLLVAAAARATDQTPVAVTARVYLPLTWRRSHSGP